MKDGMRDKEKRQHEIEIVNTTNCVLQIVNVSLKCLFMIHGYSMDFFYQNLVYKNLFRKNTYDFPGGKNAIRTDKILQEIFLKILLRTDTIFQETMPPRTDIL